MTETNPYHPPSEPQPSVTQPSSKFAPCPKCSSSQAKKVGFTWWGGAVGPLMLSHVKCQGCGAGYNGKTGQSNTTGIVIYCVVTGMIAIGAMILIQSL